MRIDKAGIYKISSEDYHADPCPEPSLSRGVIVDLIYKSPAHAFQNHPRLNLEFKPAEDVEKFDIGQVAHSLFLEGSDRAVLIDAEDWRKKEARELRDKARSEGKIPLLGEQYEKITKMVKVAERAIFNCNELGIGTLRMQGQSEDSYLWEEEGTWFRVRPDWISEDNRIILDYKTTTMTANPNELARQIINFNYDIQAAFYSRGATALNGIEPKFIFLFQETREPFLCSFIGLNPEFIEMGKQKTEYGIFLWRECLSSGNWPGYPDQVSWIDVPQWALVSWGNRATDIGV